MAAPRIFSQSRSLLSRGFATSRVATVASRSVRPAFSQRSFTSSAPFSQEVDQAPATGSEVPSKAADGVVPAKNISRCIALINLPQRAVKSEIEDFVRGEGFEIKKLQLRIDRFNLHNDGKCFIELANEKQAQEAVQRLGNLQLQDRPVSVRPVTPGFTWRDVNIPRKTDSGHTERFFFQSHEKGTETTMALKPLFEDRRCMLQVQTPGWSNKNKANREIINRHLGSFGIESIGGTSSFYGDKKPEPRILCFIDFATKEGAEAAIKAIHGTEIEGVRVSLRLSRLAPWRAHQVGKFDMNALQKLQEAGLAPMETHPDKFIKKRDGATKPSIVRRVQT